MKEIGVEENSDDIYEVEEKRQEEGQEGASNFVNRVKWKRTISQWIKYFTILDKSLICLSVN